MYRYGLTVVVCLLVSGGLAAGQTSLEPGATLGPLSTLGSPGLTGFSPPVCLSLRVPNILIDNDVGVLAIVPARDIYVSFGDTVFPGCVVENFGAQTQTNVPVVCVFYDTSAGARVYGPETVYVASLDSGGVDTVEFPSWVPLAEERVYFDTMATGLPGDENPANDWKAGRLTVSEWGLGHLSYNDGVFDACHSWVAAGCEMAERFVAPERPLTLVKAALWITGHSGADYASEVRIYGNDGTPQGYPGTQLGAWVGRLHTDMWPLFYKNDVYFDPSVEVDYDTFFVSYYQTSISPAYPYLALDTIGNTGHWHGGWGRGQGNWIAPDSVRDPNYDYGIDVYYVATPGIENETGDNVRVSFAIAPNPVSGFATVRYSLPKAGFATLDVYDVTGREVQTQTMAVGRTGTASLDLRKLTAGVYVVKVTAEGFSTTQKLVVER